MSLRTLTDIKLPVTASETELVKLAEKKLGRKCAYFRIKKKSLDARDKNDIRFVYSIEFSEKAQTPQTPSLERLPKNKLPNAPVLVVGSGPAGLFCALRLLKRGITPIVVERGAPVEERENALRAFFLDRVLDENTNVQFGEGGAGTFSDGKLNTQTHSPLNAEVLQTFADFGAPAEILWLNKPHIGSDNLKKVVKNMREYIIQNGGEVRFHTRLEDIKTDGGRLQEVALFDLRTKTTQTLPVSALALAVGHSARDTFTMLDRRGVKMTAKDFAVGVRIEHLQKSIGAAQYGKAHTLLPAADYKLVSHANERAAFTFCMCPGGYVMPAASEAGGVVTNGMSNYARDGENANSALIVQVRKTDFASGHALAGIEFQRTLECAAYRLGGGDYKAPVQLIGDFLRDKTSASFGEVKPTYAAGTAFADLREALPAFITDALKAAILQMDKRLRGFACPDGVLTASETRTSSPVRIERDRETLCSVNVVALYPCGEGAAVVYQMDSEYTYFLTNYHVVYDKDEVGENKISDEIHCYLYGSESKPTQTDGGFTYDEYAIACEYIGGSISYDLALVRAQTSAVKAVNESVQAVTLADTYYVGETAVAIGNPRGYCISVTKGTVSVDSEKMTLSGIDGTSRTYRAMRMDTPIYGGNSGGGLFNARGELIGLVNAKSTEDNNICFAIPLPIVKAVAHNLLANQDEKGVRAITLGIEYAAKNSKYTYDAASGFGTITEDTLVVSVTEGSIAEQLGLQANDTIKAIAFGGETYPLTRSFQLSEYKLYLGTGTAFTLTYERDGEEATTQAYTVQDGDLETIE